MSSKKIKTGHLSLDPYENAINVEYEVTVTDSNGQVRGPQNVGSKIGIGFHKRTK